ncbi:DHH family phosphoesterase [Natronomonas sp. EA1]|uniref:DHH family phosphoesterase n=1 Tax=Natronomonas sp. EA1 TaxID=3421655 RepID=UPI003EBBFB8F
MANCIICGTSAEGPICETHQEDVVFEFRGDRPGQLTQGRYYRGKVDGYADFGVFVNLSDRVTGLLHRSKLKRRLESLDWEVGDEVYVQVTNIRDNGDVDLGWSIRQSDRDFRGVLVQTPSGDTLPEGEVDEEPSGRSSHAEPEPVERESEPETAPEPEAEPEPEPEPESEEAEPEPEPAAEEASEAEAEPEPEPEPESRELDLVAVEDLRDNVGADVRVEGEVVSVRQTSGPTVFELRDETGVVDAAAFIEPGVRAYPEVETGDIVRLDGEVRVRRDEIQLETETLLVLEGEEREAVLGRMEDALDEQATPETVEPLAEDDVVAGVTEDIQSAAATIRRAVFESRPVVIRHNATTDGYVAGAAIERAVLPLVKEEHANADASYHYFDRRPLEDGVYDLDDATGDVTRMLDNQERHDEKLPLFVFAAAGSTADSLDGIGLLSVYGADHVVVDGLPVDDEVGEAVDTVVSADGERTASTLAATVAAAINEDVRGDLGHLPAISYWEDTPEAYAALAEEAGIDAEAAEELREAIALEAYYQSYEDKRELIIDLLFEQQHGLAAQVSEQFREKLGTELRTARANLETREAGGQTFAVLDTDKFTHRFDFPPTALLLDALHREREDWDVTVGVAADELLVRADADLDLRDIAAAAGEELANAGLSARGARTGKLVFLSGEREAVLDAVVETVADRL